MSFDSAAMGVRIRALRKDRAMTQAELAGELGLSVSFLGHVERGTRTVSLSTLCLLSDVLGVSTEYLLRGRKFPSDDCEVRRRLHRALRELRSALPDEWLEDDDRPDQSK